LVKIKPAEADNNNNNNISYKNKKHNSLVEFENDTINEKMLCHDFNLSDIDQMDIIFDEIVKKELELLNIAYKVKNNYQIVIDSTLKKSFKTTYLNYNFYDCDPDGVLINSELHHLKEKDLNIKNTKEKIIVSYLKSKGVNDIEIKEKGIKFSCNHPNHPPKNNKKCWIWNNSFKIISHSHSDCCDEQHKKTWDKWTKEMKKQWNDSKEKSKLVFNMSEDYLRNIVKTYFPKIIKQKGTCMLFKWNGISHYEEMKDNGLDSELEKLIYKYFKKENDEILTIKEMRDVKQFILRSDLFPEKTFESSYLYNCSNGVLNIETRELKPHNSKYFFNYCANIEYNVNADTTDLYNYINTVVTEENPIELIEKILAHIHYQGKKLEKGFLFYGTKDGRNGKGTLVDLITLVIGEQRSITIRPELLDESSFSTYNLKDKALFIIDDYKKDYLGSKLLGLLNTLISGKHDQVHQKGKDIIDIKYTAIPIIQCNKVPKIKADDDGGFYQRWIVVNFKKEFGNCMNEFLGEQLLENKNVTSSMLNLLINGYHKFLERKKSNTIGSYFKKDEISHIKEWKKENNSALQFIDDCCELNNMYCCSTRELYLMYSKEWNIGGAKMSEVKFIKSIKEEFKLKTERRQIKSVQLTIIIGLKCKSNSEFNQYQNLSIVKNSL
jgi:P4 family phage/plasmid primase-like protien